MKEKIDIETKSIKENGMTRYELCWDRLHEWICRQGRTDSKTCSPTTVLEMMSQIEDEILGPMEE